MNQVTFALLQVTGTSPNETINPSPRRSHQQRGGPCNLVRSPDHIAADAVEVAVCHSMNDKRRTAKHPDRPDAWQQWGMNKSIVCVSS